ncbi:hypothetical protein FRC17_003860, partial [Serendipita sp. 399]
MSKLLVILSLAIPIVQAQQTAWGQCGGQYYNGPTTCGTASAFLEPRRLGLPRQAPGHLRPVPERLHLASEDPHPAPVEAPHLLLLLQPRLPEISSGSRSGIPIPRLGVQPNPSNALGNPAYPGNTACGSNPNWVDYLGFTYNTTFVKVYNYAVSGATIDNAIVAPFSSSIKCMDDQVADMLNYQAPGKTYFGGWTSSNALFSFWIGINDIGSTYQNGSGTNNSLLNRYFQLVQQLYDVGARNFLFLSVPPVYRTPLMLQQSASTRNQEKTVIDDYNSKLAARAADFVTSHPGATTRVFDPTSTINAILDSPSSYGLQDSTS